MKKPLRIGLTGGIGSGKTTVAKVFEVLRVPVFYADDAAKKIMNNDVVLRQLLIDQFGGQTYVNDVLNRTYLSSVVFSDPQQLAKLNALVHPAIIAEAERWFGMQSAPYVIKEAALLFESGTAADLNYIIGVSAPESIRIQRVVKRDQTNYQKVKERIEKQMDEETKMKLCNFIIFNDEAQLVMPQIIKLHEHFLQLSKEK